MTAPSPSGFAGLDSPHGERFEAHVEGARGRGDATMSLSFRDDLPARDGIPDR